MNRTKKKDLILIVTVILAALLLWGIYQWFFPRQGDRLEITVDGELYGSYFLSEDQEISIGETNRCVISNGTVKMTEANCPDQLCVHQKAIDEDGGSIICLPNKVILKVNFDGREDEVPDTMT